MMSSVSLALKQGLRFTERLTGHFSQRNLTDFAGAERQGRLDASTLELRLCMAADDVERLLDDEEHLARVTGTIHAPTLSAAAMPISDGTFQVLVHPHDPFAAREMRYRLTVCSQEGRTYFLRGDKFIHAHSVLHLWPETTTLYVSVHEGGHGEHPLGRGVVHVSPHDFARQCGSLEITHAGDAGPCLATLARAGRFLTGVLFDTYGPLSTGAHFFHPHAPPRQKRPLRVAAPEVHYFPTCDGLHLKLTRHRGGLRGPVLLIPDIGVSSRIFSLDTIETNLLEDLFAHGYDVWLLDPRSSIDLPYAEQPYTAVDVATKDLPAAVAEIRWKTGAPDVQCLAHGFGATALVLALLSGLKGVRAAVLSQNAAHVVPPPLMHAAAGLHLPELLDRVRAGCKNGEPWHQRLEEILLRAYPVIVGFGDANPISRRISLLYGPVFEVAQLNEATYWDALHELFGPTSPRCLEHLAAMMRVGHVVDAAGGNVYLSQAHRLALPLLFLHGAKNRCWPPEGTQRTFDWLCQENGAAFYRRQLVADYGHLDCIMGRNAVRDVYPRMREHLLSTAR